MSNYEGEVNFLSDGSPTSKISKNYSSSAKVKVVSLDKFNFLKIPTMLVIDIEGEEINALKGGKELISKFEPNLAIAVYHYPDHIYKIITFINSISKNYNFYLRNYSGCTLDTVLYCKRIC